MFRLFGQFFAIVAVLASAINAQCALSCAFQAMVHSSVIHGDYVESASAESSCHPEDQAPGPDGNDTGIPCSHTVLSVSSFDAGNAPRSLSTLPHFDAAPFNRLNALMVVTRTPPRIMPASPACRDVSVFSILRV